MREKTHYTKLLYLLSLPLDFDLFKKRATSHSAFACWQEMKWHFQHFQHKVPPLTESLLAIVSCWETESVFSKDGVLDKTAMFQWKATHPRCLDRKIGLSRGGERHKLGWAGKGETNLARRGEEWTWSPNKILKQLKTNKPTIKVKQNGKEKLCADFQPLPPPEDPLHHDLSISLLPLLAKNEHEDSVGPIMGYVKVSL